MRSTFLWVILKEPYWCAIIAFALNTGAYTSEILRSAFQTIKPGIIEAGQSLGISSKIIFYKIQIPIAIRQSLPCLLYTSPSPRDVEESRMPSSA